METEVDQAMASDDDLPPDFKDFGQGADPPLRASTPENLNGDEGKGGDGAGCGECQFVTRH